MARSDPGKLLSDLSEHRTWPYDVSYSFSLLCPIADPMGMRQRRWGRGAPERLSCLALAVDRRGPACSGPGSACSTSSHASGVCEPA